MDIQIHALGGTLEKMERILTEEALAEIPSIGKT
jgi:hypothetical protein